MVILNHEADIEQAEDLYYGFDQEQEEALPRNAGAQLQDAVLWRRLHHDDHVSSGQGQAGQHAQV